MNETIKDLKLTPYKYQPRSNQALSEIQHYLKAYDQAQWRLKIPFTKTSFNVIEFLSPMVRPRFVIPGVILMLTAFAANLYVLSTHLSAQSALLSYLMFMCANLGAALLLPTFLVTALNRVNHSRAKRKARSLRNDKSKELPHLEKVKNELILQLSQDYSPMLSSAAELFGGLKKEISTDQVVEVFNHIFLDEAFDSVSLLSDPEKFENGKNEFIKMLQKGLDYGADMGVIEDPKFVQFLAYSFALGFLQHEKIRPDSEYHFPNLDLERLNELYQSFRRKFLSYCIAEYGQAATAEHVEGRIIRLVDEFIASGKINMAHNFPDMEKSKKDLEENS